MNEQNQWRLPEPPDVIKGILRSPAGSLFARPWLDKAAIRVLSRWFFPLSRLWGAARLAEGSAARYCAALEIEANSALRSRIEQRLAQFELIRQRVAFCESDWDDAFFGPEKCSHESLQQIERARLIGRNHYNSQRRSFATLGLTGEVGPVGWNVPSPAAAERIYGALRDNPARAFAIPNPMPVIEESRKFRGSAGRNYWLRFKSPSERINDTVVARVYEPEDVADPPTLIFGHGICVEFDHWRGLVDEVEGLVALGIRVIRPEAPWHGRRVPPGSYGGERFIATAPLGPIDLFTSAAREWAVLIDWVRQKSSKPVAIGGSSLGAMTTQIVASNARYWPDRLHPDAMFLITHCGRVEDAVTDGTLAKAWGIEDATRKHGWTISEMEKYAPLLDAVGPTVIDPERVVTVLGEFDDVTPFQSGKALIDSWNIPEDNTFIWPRGHFSVPVGMVRDHRPLHRFKTVLDSLC